MTNNDAADIADTLPVGTQLGRYEIVRLMGRGGMGAVYEGTHRDLKKRVAIKTLHPAVAAVAGARARFLREGEAASRIQHPNVVDVTDVGSEGDTTYLVMEFLEGEDLAALIERDGALALSDAVDLMLPVIGAISAAHEEGVIHRDLKPANIFLARSKHGGAKPKVLDFGISKIGTSGSVVALTGTGASMGTPHYMPPEQVRSAAGADGRSDQYALGTILYECVTGKRAHQGETIYEVIRSVGDGNVLPPHVHRPDIPAALEQAILRAMQVDPGRRFPSVKAFGRAIIPFASPVCRGQWTSALGGAVEVESTAPAMPGVRAASPAGPVVTRSAAAASDGARQPARRSGLEPAPNPVLPAQTTLGASAAQIAAPLERRPGRLVAGAVLLAGGAAAAYFGLGFRAPKPAAVGNTVVAPAAPAVPSASPKPSVHYRVTVAASPLTARFDLDGRSVGTGRIAQDLPADGTEHVLTVTAPGFQSTELRFRDRPPAETVTLEPTVAIPPAPALPPAGQPNAAKTTARTHETGQRKSHPHEAKLPAARPGPSSVAPIIE